jgi:hypothetical protein
MREEVQEAMLKADRWSKILAIFGALGGYIAGSLLVGNVEFGLIVAALVGIGVRLSVPYHAGRAVTEDEGSALSEFPMAGDYHHGAVGGALIVGPLVTVVVAMLEPDLVVVGAVGALVTGLVFAVLQFALPK